MFREVRHTARLIALNKGWATVVLISLALGIGANSSLFTLIDAAILKRLPVSKPAELVILNWSSGNKWPVAGIIGPVTRDLRTNAVSSVAFSYDGFQKFRNDSKEFSEVFAFAPLNLNASF